MSVQHRLRMVAIRVGGRQYARTALRRIQAERKQLERFLAVTARDWNAEWLTRAFTVKR